MTNEVENARRKAKAALVRAHTAKFQAISLKHELHAIGDVLDENAQMRAIEICDELYLLGEKAHIGCSWTPYNDEIRALWEQAMEVSCDVNNLEIEAVMLVQKWGFCWDCLTWDRGFCDCAYEG